MAQEVKAKLKFLRMGPRKVRLVADLMRGKKVSYVLDRLPLVRKNATRPLLKLLQSAVANAKNNFSLEMENLWIKAITVDGGPVLKRWMPRAHGRATPVRERTSHIILVLEAREKKEKEKKAKKSVKPAKKEKVKAGK